MPKQAFLDDQGSMAPLESSSSLPLTPAALLWQDKKLLNFSSPDYLGLSQHPDMRKHAMKYLLQYGTSLCHPEISSGFLECQQEIEHKCAEALGMSLVHFFSSRTTALSFLLEHFPKDWTIFLSYSSEKWLQKTISSWGGRIIYFHELTELDALLPLYAQKFIFTSSICGITGKLSDLSAFTSIAKKHECFLLVDDTYAFGIKGKHGFGLAQGKQIDFLLCGLDHGAGASGALIAYSSSTASCFLHKKTQDRDLMITFSTLGAIEAAFELIPQFEGERMQLEQRSHWLRMQLPHVDWEASHLIAIQCEDEQDAKQRCHKLLQQDILCDIRRTSSHAYLQVVINTFHSPEELTLLLKALSAHREDPVVNHLVTSLS